MHTLTRRPLMLEAESLRWVARASAAVLVFIWLALLSAEVVSPSFEVNVVGAYQAAALAVVFAGYAVGLRRELAGGVIAVLGTALFFAVIRATSGIFPGIEAAWFAAPGVLYILSWHVHRLRDESAASGP